MIARLCNVKGCPKPKAVRGRMCPMHMSRTFKWGSPFVTSTDLSTRPEERMWLRVQGGDVTTCWLWQGALNSSGYGMVRAGGKVVGAHRLAYTHIVGEIPAGLDLDHLCRVRQCVNPWHLEPVTRAVNNARKPAAVR